MTKKVQDRPYLDKIVNNLETYFSGFTIKKYYEDIWIKKIMKKPISTPGTDWLKKALENTNFHRILHGIPIPPKPTAIPPKDPRQPRVQSSRQVKRKTEILECKAPSLIELSKQVASKPSQPVLPKKVTSKPLDTSALLPDTSLLSNPAKQEEPADPSVILHSGKRLKPIVRIQALT